MLTSKCPGITKATNWTDGDLSVSMNQSHQSPLQRVASRSFQSTIYTAPTGEHTESYKSMLGHINLNLMEEVGCSKRLAIDCTTMNN